MNPSHVFQRNSWKGHSKRESEGGAVFEHRLSLYEREHFSSALISNRKYNVLCSSLANE